ncbi:MAG: hypothetical protein ACK5L5_07275 [Bacteroidales bacterium]
MDTKLTLKLDKLAIKQANIYASFKNLGLPRQRHQYPRVITTKE